MVRELGEEITWPRAVLKRKEAVMAGKPVPSIG
jgi:hypothetical protein